METPFAVVALILDNEDNVLAITRRNEDDDWGLVGGKVDPGETATQALVREVREEVGVVVKEEDLQLIYDRDDASGTCWCYFVRTYKGEPRAMENGFKVRWTSKEKFLADTNTFHAYNRRVLEKLDPTIVTSARLT